MLEKALTLKELALVELISLNFIDLIPPIQV